MEKWNDFQPNQQQISQELRGENCYVSETTSLPFCSSPYKILLWLNKLPGLQIVLDMRQVNKTFNWHLSYLNYFFPLTTAMGQ